MIALEHSLSFSNGSWEPKLKTLSFHSKKGNEISIDDVWMDTSYVSCLLHEKKNGMMVLMKKFQLKKMFWWWFCILLMDQYIYLHWPTINMKYCYWLPSVKTLQLELLTIPTVNTSGHPYTFLRSEFKDTQKQFTENLWT